MILQKQEGKVVWQGRPHLGIRAPNPQLLGILPNHISEVHISHRWVWVVEVVLFKFFVEQIHCGCDCHRCCPPHDLATHILCIEDGLLKILVGHLSRFFKLIRPLLWEGRYLQKREISNKQKMSEKLICLWFCLLMVQYWILSFQTDVEPWCYKCTDGQDRIGWISRWW